MKMKMIAAVVGTLVAANVYAAETYNIELTGQHTKSSSDDKSDEKVTALAGTYYLKPITIDTTKPFAELDVLQRASSVSVSYAKVNSETANTTETSLNSVGVKGTFYVNDFIFGLNNENWEDKFKLKANTAFNYEIKKSTTGFNAGYWVTPTTTVSFVNEKSKATYTRSSALLDAINDDKATNNGIQSHSILSLGGTQSLVLDLGYKKIKQEQDVTEYNKEYSAKVRYYPQANFFVEGGYISNTGDKEYAKGKTTLVGAGYSFTPRFGVLLTTAKFNGDVSRANSSATQTSLTAGYRF